MVTAVPAAGGTLLQHLEVHRGGGLLLICGGDRPTRSQRLVPFV